MSLTSLITNKVWKIGCCDMRREAKTTRKLTPFQITILSTAGIVLLAFVLYVIHDASKPGLKEQTLIKQRYDIPVDTFPSVGPTDAPVVIVEFSDFQSECGLGYLREKTR